MKYEVTPQQAYLDTGKKLKRAASTCISCGQQQAYYSLAGLRELEISGMCEPCYDFVATPKNDVEPGYEWVLNVKYSEQFLIDKAEAMELRANDGGAVYPNPNWNTMREET